MPLNIVNYKTAHKKYVLTNKRNLRGSIFLHDLFTKVYIPVRLKNSIIVYKFSYSIIML